MAIRRRGGEDIIDASALPPAVPDEVIRVLSVLPSASIVTAPDGAVLRASARALSLGLVNRSSLTVADIVRLVDKVAEDGHAREQEMRVRRPPLGRELLELRVRVAPLGTGVLLILVDDLAEERRVDAVRRDFVANVSHELKTPVGALSLLAETVVSAADDPEQVRHFAERMQTEAARLASLIQDVIDLSRLQSDDPMTRAEIVDVDELVTRASDEVRTLAVSREIELVRSGEADPSEMYGDRGQLLTAVRNLLSNAVALLSPRQPESQCPVRAHEGMWQRSPSRIKGSGFLATISTGSSSASTESIKPDRAVRGERDWVCPSSSTYVKTTEANAPSGRRWELDRRLLCDSRSTTLTRICSGRPMS